MFKKLFATTLFIAGLTAWTQTPAGYTISTIAGTGTNGFAGDGAAASTAQLAIPSKVALDSSGNVYIADQGNNRVRKITSGTISTVAGSATGGYAGDGKAATAAQLNHPYDIAIDSSGNIFIADSDNAVVRKVTSDGNIATVAGNNQAGAGYSGDGSAATGAQLRGPVGVAVASNGDFYIADIGNQRIRLVTASNKNIATVVGNNIASTSGDGGPATAASVNGPQSVALDGAGNIYISESGGNRVRKIDKNGIITTVAGIGGPGGYGGDGGLATAARLYDPRGIALDAAGNLYIADYLNSRIRRVTTDGIITTIAGNGQFSFFGDGGPATKAALQFPSGVAVDKAGNIYIADAGNNVIRLLQPNGGAPSINTGGVISAAAFGGSTAVAPGTWIEIYGNKLSTAARGWNDFDFRGVLAPTVLEGTSVTIGGQSAYVAYVSPSQVNAQVPSNVTVGQQAVVVNTDNGPSLPFAVNVNAAQPGLLAPAAFNVGGKQYVTALFSDGTYVAPVGAIAGVTSRPARPGETILLFGIGFGATTPAVAAGRIIAPGQGTALANSLSISIGGNTATLPYAGLAPGAVGLYQFNLVVPAVAAGDAVPLTFTLGGVPGSQTLYTAIGN